MQSNILGFVPAIHVFALFQPLELSVDLCPGSNDMRSVEVA